MKQLQVDALTEEISISRSQSEGTSGKAQLEEYFRGWAQIRPVNFTGSVDGGLQITSTKYLFFIHNDDIPIAHNDTITWLSNKNKRFRVDEARIPALSDIWQTFRATAERF